MKDERSRSEGFGSAWWRN